MIFYNKQPLAVLCVVGVLFIPALLLYWFGFPSIATMSFVFMVAGIFVTVSQFLSYYKIDHKNQKFTLTHGWFFPREFRSVPFDHVKQLSIGFFNSESKTYFLFLDLKDNTSISLYCNKFLAPLNARAQKIARLMKTPLVDQTNWVNPTRQMSKFPDDSSIQLYLFMGYVFVVFPVFLVLAGFGSIAITASERRAAGERALDRLYASYQPVVDEAERIESECEELDDGYLLGKIAVRLPQSNYKEDWRRMLPPQYKPTYPSQVKTVILVDSFEHDWGTSSGTIVLLDKSKKFHFSVSSNLKEKRLGSTVRADDYLYKYLMGLPAR